LTHVSQRQKERRYNRNRTENAVRLWPPEIAVRGQDEYLRGGEGELPGKAWAARRTMRPESLPHLVSWALEQGVQEA